MTLEDLYSEKKSCSACRLRAGCIQVVPGTGCMENVPLLVIGEGPGQDEDEQGVPFVGQAGQVLREVLRATKVLNRTNTLITNVLGCRPAKNKFPNDDCPKICVSKWLWKEIDLAAPQRMLLLGGTPLKYVAGMDGITAKRGQWFTIKGVRTMPTFHPSYVLRTDRDGMTNVRDAFERDVAEMAAEVSGLK